MSDQITLQRIEKIHPKLKLELVTIYKEIETKLTGDTFCRFAYTLRTFAEQDTLYARGRTVKGKVVTNAKAGQSYHNFGMAVDIVLIREGKAIWDRGKDFDGDKMPDWMEVVKVFQGHGWEWGGTFHSLPDYPHFQKTFGYSCKELMALPKYPKTTYPIIK